MVDSKQLEPEENERREKTNRRLVIFGILVVFFIIRVVCGLRIYFWEKINAPLNAVLINTEQQNSRALGRFISGDDHLHRGHGRVLIPQV